MMKKYIDNNWHKIISYLWIVFAYICMINDKTDGVYFGITMSAISYLTHMVYTSHKQYLEIEMAKAKIEKRGE